MASNLKPGDQVFIPASVLRVRAGVAEMQLGDGQMVRTVEENVRRQPQAKAVKAAPENKAVKPGENKTERK